jgi:hypothetical protein
VEGFVSLKTISVLVLLGAIITCVISFGIPVLLFLLMEKRDSESFSVRVIRLFRKDTEENAFDVSKVITIAIFLLALFFS